VEIPNGKYSGQKLIKLVRMTIPARTNKTIANVPEIIFVKYKLTIKIAKSILTTLSAVPIFGFIVLFFM
jgi:hypothetical protein